MIEKEQLMQNFASACWDASDHESDVRVLTEEIEDVARFRGPDVIQVYKQLQDLAHKLIHAAQRGILLEERIALIDGYVREYDKEHNNASPV